MEDNKICTNPQCFCDGSCKGVVKSDANYSSEATMENKTAEEMITRGTGNFINCTDYEDAISVIKNLQQQLAEKDKEIESYMSLLDDASKTVVEKDKEIERLVERNNFLEVQAQTPDHIQIHVLEQTLAIQDKEIQDLKLSIDNLELANEALMQKRSQYRMFIGIVAEEIGEENTRKILAEIRHIFQQSKSKKNE